METTVFHGAWNFEPSCGICLIAWNFSEFGTGRSYGDKYSIFWSGATSHRKLMLGLHRHGFVVKYMTATQAVIGEILKILNLLFGRQTVSVSCSFWRQMLHIWLCGELATEFRKICRTKLVPSDNCAMMTVIWLLLIWWPLLDSTTLITIDHGGDILEVYLCRILCW